MMMAQSRTCPPPASLSSKIMRMIDSFSRMVLFRNVSEPSTAVPTARLPPRNRLPRISTSSLWVMISSTGACVCSGSRMPPSWT